MMNQTEIEWAEKNAKICQIKFSHISREYYASHKHTYICAYA